MTFDGISMINIESLRRIDQMTFKWLERILSTSALLAARRLVIFIF